MMERAVIFYFILGGLIFGVTMWRRKDMRKTFLSYGHSGRLSIAIMAILAWWLTIIYAIRKESKEEKS